MKFLDELRAYLARPEPPRPAFEPDVAAHRKHLLDSLDTVQAEGRSQASIQAQLERWNEDYFRQFVNSLGLRIIEGFGHACSREEVEWLIDVAIDRALGLATSTRSISRDWEIDRLRSSAFYAGRPEARAARYAVDQRAVRHVDDHMAITPIGKLVLELPVRDAVRWLLAVEIVQSSGAGDDWRLSKETAAQLLATPEGSFDTTEDDDDWPIRWVKLEHLSRLGLLHLEDHYPLPFETYRLLPEGRRLLEEVASDQDTPFMLLARALLQDETAGVLGQYAATAATRSDSAASIVTRHARMVAHDMRNVVVPMQIALEAFCAEVGERGKEALGSRHRAALDAGIDRILRFVQDVSEIADLATTPAELFTVARAVEDAIQAVSSELPEVVSFVQAGEPRAVMGYRQRFIMAVGNLLRNSAQAREQPPVKIQITVGVNNGAEVFVSVDDDGPGVPAEQRESVFTAGFSRRPGGSGQGLAHAREVVEEEMAGKLTCEESPLGGARFVIRLPVGTRRSV